MPRAPGDLTTWASGLRKSFRLLPTEHFDNRDLRAFLDVPEGADKREVLNNLPYDAARAQGTEDKDEEGEDEAGEGGRPDARRYRDPRIVFESCGLLWEDDDGRIRFTDFGRALKRFLPIAHEKNVLLYAKHAALALSICQLRNPTRSGQRYHRSMEVFPYRFIWEAMLALDLRISSDELNRAMFRTRNRDTLGEAIDKIRRFRRDGNVGVLGEEVVSGKAKNDRIIPPVSIASFGWTLLTQKDEEGYYRIRPECLRMIEAAVSIPARHREYESVAAYVTAVSNAACLPEDLR